MKKDKEIIQSSGNVYQDFEVPEATLMRVKAKLASGICDIIEKRGLTQKQAAKILGIDQPKVSALMTGKLRGFATGRLFRYLTALGQDIEIIVHGHRRQDTVGNIKVRAGAAKSRILKVISTDSSDSMVARRSKSRKKTKVG